MMKKLFFLLLCTMCIGAVKADSNTITIRGILRIVPNICISDPCRTGYDWAICTSDSTYFIKYKESAELTTTPSDKPITITIDGVETVITEGNEASVSGIEVVASGTLLTLVDVYGDKHYVIDINSIQQAETTAIQEVQADPTNAHKIIENGQLVIIRDDVRYNILGAAVK